MRINENNKWLLIASATLLLTSLCVILPIERSKSDYISNFVYTYWTLGLAMLLGMYSLLGKNFIRALLFLIFSVVFSFLCWYFFFFNDFWRMISAVYGGIPSGLATGLLFLVIDVNFLVDERKNVRLIKRLLTYLLLLLIVSVLFAKGGDWIFEFSEYLKDKT